MHNVLSDDECKSIISILAKKLMVRASLITTHLLSEEDKNAMREGDIAVDSLEAHIRAWIGMGIPNLIQGKSLQNDPEFCVKTEKAKIGLNRPFVSVESFGSES